MCIILTILVLRETGAWLLGPISLGLWVSFFVWSAASANFRTHAQASCRSCYFPVAFLMIPIAASRKNGETVQWQCKLQHPQWVWISPCKSIATCVVTKAILIPNTSTPCFVFNFAGNRNGTLFNSFRGVGEHQPLTNLWAFCSAWHL